MDNLYDRCSAKIFFFRFIFRFRPKNELLFRPFLFFGRKRKIRFRSVSTTNTMNVNGPRNDPCGMPASITSQSDITSPILTRWCRSYKNEHIHRMMTSGRPNSINFAIRMLWSTWSNALPKSMKTARTDWPSSTALCQWCTMSTRVCVVDRPFKAPYWLTSNLSLILSSIQPPMNDSNSLLSVGNWSQVYFSHLGTFTNRCAEDSAHRPRKLTAEVEQDLVG